MKVPVLSLYIIALFFSGCGTAHDSSVSAARMNGPFLRWEALPNLPRPVSNNAVAAVTMNGREYLYSFMGMDRSKSRAGIHASSYRYDPFSKTWSVVSSVPGKGGRIGATAESVEGKIYLFGGFTVDDDFREVTVPTVNIYDPARDVWSVGASVPVPVDDTVSGVWRGRLIFLVSGWDGRKNVKNVQFYDPRANRWGQATPIPGPPVFGHAGAIVGDTIVYCDGVEAKVGSGERYVLSKSCFQGDIDGQDPARIKWSSIPSHRGGAKYRMAAGPVPGRRGIVFTGGGDGPYNYDGIGYDGVPVAPTAETHLYDLDTRRWKKGADNLLPTMDHRGLAGAGKSLYLIGGMTSRRKVTGNVGKVTVESGERPGGIRPGRP